MEEKTTSKQTGELIISEDVIAKIAGVAAGDVAGVAGIVPIPADLKSVLRRGKAARAVRVSSVDSAMTIDIALSLLQGAKVSEVCPLVQKAVKNAVQNMVGRPVARVNVIVADAAPGEEPRAED